MQGSVINSEVSMGGIKNKPLLNKAVNKGSLWVKGAVSPLGLTEGSLSAGLKLTTLTKYLGIACISLAILSTLVLNIVSSYSYSKVNSNAEPVGEVSTLANSNDSSTCNPSNTNAASCISMSISSHSATGDTNDGNLSLSIPQGGGLVAGRHTVEVSSNNYTGYSVKMRIDSNTTSLVNSNNTAARINSVSSDTISMAVYLQNNQWGMAFPGSTGNEGGIGAQYDSISQYEQTLSDPSLALNRLYGMAPTGYDDEIMSSNTLADGETQNIYYAVRIDDPVELPAGDYSTNIVLTATTNSVKAPTINSVTPNTYELGSGADSTVTIAGANLASTYDVYLESTADSSKQYNVTDNVTSVTDAELKVTLPADKTNTDLEPGDYTIHVVTQGGEDSIGFTYTKKALPDGMLESTDDYGDDGHVAVDYDENLIPIKISSNRYGSPTITAIPKSEIDSDPSVWYDYSADKKQWANAVTVTNPENYKNITSETTINDSDILGYWVYIPRYAYKVMRRDASDRAVSDTTASRNGGFEIKFETASDPKKTPVKCSRTGQDYQTCVGASALEYPTDPADKDKTAWATHPAFSWGTDADGYEEMNGFWIGKFETTEPQDGQSGGYPGGFVPTILPGEYTLGLGMNTSDYGSSEGFWSGIGDMYNTAKLFGVSDPDNKFGLNASGSGGGWPGSYGESISGQFKQDGHHLSLATSHMIKNNEWGAVLYLASSKFGAGVGKVESSSKAGITSCGPNPPGPEYCSITNQNSQTASTTGTEYGVFDMVSGGYEIVAARSKLNGYYEDPDGFAELPQPPYAQVYYSDRTDSCTWETCGGDATYEVATSTIYPNEVASGNNAPMWFGGFGKFSGSGFPWIMRSIDSYYYQPDQYSDNFMYSIDATNNSYVENNYQDRSGPYALRVVLRNSMDGEVSGGNESEGGDDEGEEQPSRITVYNVVPPSAEAYFETEYQMSGTNLQLVNKLLLTSSNGAQWECQIGSHTNTHIKCTAMTISFQPGPITATFYDSNDNLLLKMENFSTITANDWSQ